MYIQALRHKQNKKKFLHLISDGRGDFRYPKRLVVSNIPQLLTGKKSLGSILHANSMFNWLSPENIQEIRDNYEFVEVTLSYPNN
jgi:glutaredoxin-related protein